MKKSKTSLWSFLDDKGSFCAPDPHRVSRLYFPLANDAGFMSAITPDLHGDIKAGQNAFLTQPVSEQDLHNIRSRRDFWILTDVPKGRQAWCANAGPADKSFVEAGPLWHRLIRENNALGIRVEMTNVIPSNGDSVELMEVRITNTGRRTSRLRAVSAVPIYGRSADNLRDHRHVTSLLHRVQAHPHGVLVTPTMTFDERGHRINTLTYAVLGCDERGGRPAGSYPTVESFIGEGGDFDRPRAILENIPPPSWKQVAGKEAMGAIAFKPKQLRPGESFSYLLLLGIATDKSQLVTWLQRAGSRVKFLSVLSETRAYWEERLNQVRVRTGEDRFDNWFRWVTLQPMLRKIFGCSYLPDFDYGRGGRGWRDLWQDCLALLLLRPHEARPLLLNNFAGIRIDGSNATIIGRAPGEFLADRNNITRVWMDHGVWPLLTTELYIHQSGDFSILWEKCPYFRDPQLMRAREKDAEWSEKDGRQIKTVEGEVYQGTVLEHILIQTLSAFFNVGEHNVLRLEDADWNDGLDMAHDRGESVAFSALYSGNLNGLADLLEKTGAETVTLAEEVMILLDRAAGESADYGSARAKRDRLENFYRDTLRKVSGQTRKVAVASLVRDLRAKAEWLSGHIRRHEWVRSKSGHEWFNGYYDNEGRRVEGDSPKGVRMTLTGQVFPVMSGVATEEQVQAVCRAAKRYLKDSKLGGFRLNTDFKEIQPALGRAFSFAYGEKENGAFFSHMAVMFANALYRRNFVKEGREALMSLYEMASDTGRSRIYPGLPEYFNGEGRGMYHYLTGSASWFVLTYLTQVCGVRGLWGDLLLAPKLTSKDFGSRGEVIVETSFAGKRLKIVYKNEKRVEFGHYRIQTILSGGDQIQFREILSPEPSILIQRSQIERFPSDKENILDVILA
ncbi:MAG: cellobiose phosphorylase [Elusimicrobia bacterium]|nr:cellobiose phosphorylase [Elusimicrobiota bacterium]